jgi:hypothetical protein
MRTWNSSILGLKEPILISGCFANAPWRQSSDGSYVMTPTIVRIQPLGPNSTHSQARNRLTLAKPTLEPRLYVTNGCLRPQHCCTCSRQNLCTPLPSWLAPEGCLWAVTAVVASWVGLARHFGRGPRAEVYLINIARRKAVQTSSFITSRRGNRK